MSQLRTLFNNQQMWRSETDLRRYDFEPFNEIVDIHTSQLRSYTEHLQVLLKRCKSTAHLLEQLVASKNQKLTTEQSNYILALTKAAAEDSAAIRVITVITLIYLSSTVVAVSRAISKTTQHADKVCRRLWTCHSSTSTAQDTCKLTDKYGFMWSLLCH